MKEIGVSVALVLAFATLVSGFDSMYSPDCTYCPPCVTQVQNNYTYPVKDICSFCRCIGGKPTQHKCLNYMKYDPVIGKCVKDDTGNCTRCCDDCCKNQCPICYSGIDYPIKNPRDKCMYCLCAKDGNLSQKRCRRGYRFNEDTHDCDIPDPDCGRCPGVVCQGGDVEQHFPDLSSEDNCDFCCCKPHDLSVYRQICPWGEKFIGGTCDSSTRGQCDATRSLEPVLADDCASIVCAGDPSKSPLYPDPIDNHYYCECDWGGRAHQMPCAPGQIFNYDLQTCVPENRRTRGQYDATRSLERVLEVGCSCVHCPTDPSNSPLFPSCDDDHYYCECDWGGTVHEMPCIPGNIFNYDLQTCVPENRRTRGQYDATRSLERILEVNCSCVYCPTDPTNAPLFPSCDDDHYYCQCDWGGTVHEMPCIPGNIFNYELQTCVPENRHTRGQCDPKRSLEPGDDCACLYCTGPSLSPDPNDDHYYCECDGPGPAHQMPCPPGEIFNDDLKTCIPENRRTRGQCDPKTSLEPGDDCACLICTDHSLSPDPNDDHYYCECDGPGLAHQVPCPPGEIFNDDLKTCIPENRRTRGQCDPKRSLEPGDDCACLYCTGPSLIPDPNDDHYYCECDGPGLAHQVPCPPGEIFNDDLKTCIPENRRTRGQCDPKRSLEPGDDCACLYCTGPSLIPDPNDDHYYCECDGPGLAHQVPCPPGEIFNDDLKTCIPENRRTRGQCDPKRSLEPGDDCACLYCTGHSLIPDPNDDHYYCECDGPGPAHQMPCPPGEIFNDDLKTCIPENRRTRGQYDATRSLERVLDGGCSCVHCPPDPTKAPLFPSCDDVHSYCQCDHGGIAHEMPCPPGEIFYDNLQSCVPENRRTRGQCDTTRSLEPGDDCSCYYCTASSVFPDPNDYHYYCECDGPGPAYQKPCPPGEIFNDDLHTCVPENRRTRGQYDATRLLERVLEGECSCVHCPIDPTNAPLFPSCDDDHYYCQCDWGGHVHIMSCPPGYIFDNNLQTCVPENRR